MKDEKIYEKVCSLLSAEDTYGKMMSDFDSICAKVGVGRVRMNNILYERLGMSGDDILMAFRYGKARITY